MASKSSVWLSKCVKLYLPDCFEDKVVWFLVTLLHLHICNTWTRFADRSMFLFIRWDQTTKLHFFRKESETRSMDGGRQQGRGESTDVVWMSRQSTRRRVPCAPSKRMSRSYSRIPPTIHISRSSCSPLRPSLLPLPIVTILQFVMGVPPTSTKM